MSELEENNTEEYDIDGTAEKKCIHILLKNSRSRIY